MGLQLAPNIFRGPQVGWGSILATFFGVPALGLTSISYSSEREKEVVYGAGNYPQGIGYGNYKYTGELEMYRWQVNDILAGIRALGGNGLEDAPTTAVTIISTTVPVGGNETYTDVWQMEFTKTSRDLKQGDKMDKVKVPCILTGLKWSL